MNSTIIFLSFLFVFLTIMLKFKIAVEIDYELSYIKIIVSLFKIRILTIQLFLFGLYYKINTSKKIKTLDLIISKDQKYLLLQIKNSVLDKLYYDNFMVVNAINTDNPDADAIIVGELRLLTGFILNYLKINKVNKNIQLYSYSEFKEFSKTIINFNVYFTIFDLIFAIIFSFYKRGKYVRKNKKRFC